MPVNKWLNYLGILLVVIFLLVAGFYFGYKTKEASSDNLTATGQDITVAAQQVEKTEIKALEVTGVFWIKPNSDPVCPQNYLVKGTFTSTGGYFYTKDNKSYDRIKPDICFATEEFAKDTAGFIKKF